MTVVFWASALIVLHTYVGYPVWLWLRGRWRPCPVRRGTCEPLVSVVMVVRNGEPTVAKKIRNLLELDYPADRLQVVVVSDGSTDRTDAILREQVRDSRVQVVCNQLARGKACGLNDGIRLVQGDIVVFTDVRQTIERGAVRLLLENFADPEIGAVSGELMLGDPSEGETNRGLGLYWRVEKRIREWEAQSGSVIGVTGALYAARRSLLPDVPEDTILDDVFIPMSVLRRGYRVVFDPRARAWDMADLGRDREFARKVRTLNGNYQLLQLAPWLLMKENPARFEFVSHKLMRLISPFALAGMLVASAFLQQPMYRITLVLQLGFYFLSALAPAHLTRGSIGRVADAAFTFVLLNTAAVVAFAHFVTGRKAAWRP
jgi:biofilm PGA synthesis N-glycosyltransferase PgaC